MPSGITNLSDLQTFSVSALVRALQARGNLRMFGMNMDQYKSPLGRRLPVRVPIYESEGKLTLTNPETGVTQNRAAVAHSIIEWNTGAADTDTSYLLAVSYDRWELQSSSLAVETVNQKAATQVDRYDQSFDRDVITELKKAENWGATANQKTITMKADPSSSQLETAVKAILEIPWEVYHERGMTRMPGGDDDGSPQREIIGVINRKFMTALIGEYFDDVAVGAYATQSSQWLQATLGPMLGGMTLVVSREMDNTLTSAGDEFIFGTFLRGSLAYVTDRSPNVDAIGYNGGNPTLEQRMGFYWDHGVKQILPNECFALKAQIA